MADGTLIRELLTRETAGVERLCATLKAEEQALIQRDADALDRLVAEKQSYVAELESLGAEQRRMLEAAGFAADRGGLEAMLLQVPGTPGEELRAFWQSLHEKLRTCRDQNLANGRLLEGNRRFAQQALTALLGAEAGTTTELYDRAGGTSVAHGNRTYAKV